MCNATFADGKIGQAFSLDGVNSYVKIPQSPNLNLTDQSPLLLDEAAAIIR